MARQPRRKPSRREPWQPAEWEPADAAALQALARGEADAGAQGRALKWIIEKAAGTYDQSFYPDNARVGDFLEGRRSVGNQILKLVKINLSTSKQVDNG